MPDLVTFFERSRTGDVQNEFGRLLQTNETSLGNNDTCTFDEVLICQMNRIVDNSYVEQHEQKDISKTAPAAP
jgi:hypothetical protein